MPRQARRDTGVPTVVRNLVLARDCHACVCCGTSITGEMGVVHFRKPEHLGGPAAPENLITLLRTCRERISLGREPQDEAWGYRLRPGDDPALVPVVLVLPTGPKITVWLTRDGLLSFDPPPGACA